MKISKIYELIKNRFGEKNIPNLYLSSLTMQLLVTVGLIGAAYYIGTLNSSGTGLRAGAAPTAPTQGAPRIALTDLPKLAASFGVKEKDFNKCFESGETKDIVARDEKDAQASGANGTPTNFIFDTKTGKYKTVVGAQPLNVLQAALVEFDNAEGVFDTVTIRALDNTDHVRGADNSRFIVFEYSDYDCPFCQRHHTTMQQLVDANKEVRWVYRHLPLDQLHPDARRKAESAECVAKLKDSETFWKYSDKLITNQL